jgi:hypothetical protein
MVSPDLLNEDILSLGMRADAARRSGETSTRVWYQRVHVIAVGDVQNGFAIPEAASEVRVLGMPATLDDATTLARAVKKAAGPRPVAAFSAADLLARTRAGWGDLEMVLTQLASAGLTDLAELPIDALDDVQHVIRVARGAGLRAARLTTAHAVADRRAEILERIRRAIVEGGGIVRVNPLPRTVATDRPTTGYEDVRMVALARLALSEAASGPPIFVEVDWSLYGPKLAQVALTFGADFLDAVPATTDDSLGRRRGTVEDVERNIRAAGFEPQEYRPEQSRGA